MMPSSAHTAQDLRDEALAAARGLQRDETALARVLRDLERERGRTALAQHAVLRSLAAALHARDGRTAEHAGAVGDLAAAVARRLGLDPPAVAEVHAVALLHDLGKIGVPDAVLGKPGPLTDEEWEQMREHPLVAERILRPLPGLDDVATAVRHEHERWDGTGYPDGLAGEAIPLASRIVLACDAYDALVRARPYRPARSPEEAVAELRRCAGTQFDARVVDALVACLAEPDTIGGDDPEQAHRALDPPEAPADEDRLARELHAQISIASAVSGAHRLEDVVELTAEHARDAIGAASLSISRWEVERRILRTLVNVGDLAPGEERLPADEVYRLDEDDQLRRLLEDGRSYVASVGDPGAPELERELLRKLGKEHCVGVPIMFAGGPWGELWATRTAEQGPFDERDVRFLQSICGQIAGAVGRAELFSRMSELAFEDPLTGVANRRALDERLELSVGEAVAADEDLAVILCDVDNLKELNDVHGHHAGDAALIAVGATLLEVAGDGMVARVGGDEFCVLLERTSAERAFDLAEGVLGLLAAREGPALSVSCGVASLRLGTERAGDLLRAADVAQYTAKRSGRARVCVAEPDVIGAWRTGRSERRAIRGRRSEGTVEVAPLLAGMLDALDGPLAAASALDRLEAVTMAVAAALDASAAAVSFLALDGDTIETLFAHDWRTGRTSGRRQGSGEGERFDASAYPASAAVLEHGGSFVARVDDADADPGERALLAEFGMDAVVVAGAVQRSRGGWLVEIYADGLTRPVGDAEPALRLLSLEAVRGGAPEPLRAVG